MDVNTWMGILRAIVPAGIAFGVGKGWFTGDQAAGLTNAIVAGVPAIGAAIWSIFSNLKPVTPSK